MEEAEKMVAGGAMVIEVRPGEPPELPADREKAPPKKQKVMLFPTHPSHIFSIAAHLAASKASSGHTPGRLVHALLPDCLAAAAVTALA